MTRAAAKAALRAEAVRLRAAAHAAEPGAGAALAAHLAPLFAAHPGAVIAGYLPFRTEIDPLPAMIAALARGPVAVPVVTGAGAALAFRLWQPGAALEPGPFGTRHPAAGEEVVPRIVLVPLLGFDRRGARLGFGGGYYDRTLAALRTGAGVLAVGLAYAAQELPQVPEEPFDMALDAVATEQGLFPVER